MSLIGNFYHRSLIVVFYQFLWQIWIYINLLSYLCFTTLFCFAYLLLLVCIFKCCYILINSIFSHVLICICCILSPVSLVYKIFQCDSFGLLIFYMHKSSHADYFVFQSAPWHEEMSYFFWLLEYNCFRILH